MKHFLMLFLFFGSYYSNCQIVYEVRLFDKSSGQIIPCENLIISPKELIINYGQKEIIFPILESNRPEKYLDIFIDTTFNSADCYIFFHEHEYGSVNNGGKCSDDSSNIGYHVIRNLPKFDKTPQHDFSFEKFLDYSKSNLYLNATTGYAYQGFQVGASLKYGFIALVNYIPWNVNVQFSKMFSGPLYGGIEFTTGLRFGVLGAKFSTLLFEDQFISNIAPEFALDLWLFHLSYSYNFSLSGSSTLTNSYRHRFDLGIGINLSSPIRSRLKKFPCCTHVGLLSQKTYKI